MTMADERTRGLRFGWEFLLEMRDSDCLTEEQRVTVEKILRHYPSGAEIKQWALECAQACDQSMFRVPDLAPEEPRHRYPDDPVFVDSIERGPTTPWERAIALRQAFELIRFGLSGGENLTEKLKRQIPYVLRHFPDIREIEHWARSDGRRATKDGEFLAWLLPEVLS